MIAIDTSAIVAIVFKEPEREHFIRIIQRADRALVSTVSIVEARMGCMDGVDSVRYSS